MVCACPSLPYPVLPVAQLTLPHPVDFDNPRALAVLLEEELVVLDLKTPGWPALPAPYLAPLHSSAITCSAHVANVPAKLWARIVSAGEQQSPQPASSASVWSGAPCRVRLWGAVCSWWKVVPAKDWKWECIDICRKL